MIKNLSLFIIISLLTSAVLFRVGLQRNAAMQDKKTGTNITMVSLLANGAQSDIITAKVGTYVQFNTMDGKTHILAQGSGNGYGQAHEHQEGLESSSFGPNEAYKVLFKKVGIYDFHDHLNPKIHITVVVNNK